MNKKDSEFWNAFLAYIKDALKGTIEKFLDQLHILPTNVHLLSEKSKLRDTFYTKVEIVSPFKEFAERNKMSKKDIDLAIFDALWEDFAKEHSIIV